MERKTKGIYRPGNSTPYILSRSKIDLFKDCPRCFYLNRRLGIQRPPIPSFSLNNAVDALLKKEFDYYRKLNAPHPIMKQYGINAIPYDHPDLQAWQDALRRGITWLDDATNFVVTGGIDDVWIDSEGKLIVIDYKATSKETISLDSKWGTQYKRQLEVYQWLFERNGFIVSNTAYLLFCNADKSVPSFNGNLSFDMTLVPHKCDTTWIRNTLQEIREALDSGTIPQAQATCDYCTYHNLIKHVEQAPDQGTLF